MLDRRKEGLINQFTAMEAAIAKIQSQGTAITNFLKSMQSQNG